MSKCSKKGCSKGTDKVYQHLKDENEYLKKRNAEIFSELQRVKKVANNLFEELNNRK